MDLPSGNLWDLVFGDGGFTDNIVSLQPEDDAAVQILGDKWCFTFTSKSTGNVLYFPVWGYKDENGNTVSYNQYGYYWSSDEEDEENASVLRLDLIHGERVSSKEKRYALQIRPARDIKQ